MCGGHASDTTLFLLVLLLYMTQTHSLTLACWDPTPAPASSAIHELPGGGGTQGEGSERRGCDIQAL